MVNLLLEDIIFAVPIIFFAIVFAVIIVIAVVNAKKRQDAQKSASNYRMQMQQRQNNANSNPRSESYASRAKTVVTDADAHAHVGEEEHYEKIVGSLGEVDDEGCADLDGIRLIAHDEAYEGNAESRNYSDIVKAMVLGDILDKPRFKNPRK